MDRLFVPYKCPVCNNIIFRVYDCYEEILEELVDICSLKCTPQNRFMIFRKEVFIRDYKSNPEQLTLL